MTTKTVLPASQSKLSLYLRAILTLAKPGRPVEKKSRQLVFFDKTPTDSLRLISYQKLCQLHSDAYLPITYPHVLSFNAQLSLLVSEAFTLPVIGLVHTRNIICSLKPIPVESCLEINCYLGKSQNMPKGIQTELLTEVKVDNELMWQSRSFYLYLTTLSAQQVEAKPEFIELPEDINWRSEHFSVAADIGKQYARISGDFNPIHLSNLTARLFGFKQTIAHGMWLKAAAIGQLNIADEHIQSVEVNFKKPVKTASDILFKYAQKNSQRYFLMESLDKQTQHLVGRLNYR
ncbi:hypothetical protein FLL45_06790 [Aliikangiella marina]|uniref:MaoC-like domain-containing protein n=1 Tax=Aliikangiella marina TaxID=1712262 RepID=A0A545TBR1_9GAMM|nr:MaoC/PaaZ C-terminal domain-containing protein [Aliikangiella marina]TQV74662.1 hypothetical protein FLL45_06790 [Aliikangiella marina]